VAQSEYEQDDQAFIDSVSELVVAELAFTRHGPVLHRDSANHIAYALRAAWLDIGAAPYLASLRMDQARTWEEFREACSYSRLTSFTYASCTRWY
jgi:hypothetical protein